MARYKWIDAGLHLLEVDLAKQLLQGNCLDGRW